MFSKYFGACEKSLKSQGERLDHAGHPVIKGSAREIFVSEFLSHPLPSSLDIGQGELINALSSDQAKRHQADIVIYKKNMPRLEYAKNQTAFLLEGVVAVIECKSTLTKSEFFKACDTFREYQASYPEIKVRPTDTMSTYLIAYKGPKKMESIEGWFAEYRRRQPCTIDQLVDMIIIIGVGVICKANFFNANCVDLHCKSGSWSLHNWALIYSDNCNLALFYSHLMHSIRNEAFDCHFLIYNNYLYSQRYSLF